MRKVFLFLYPIKEYVRFLQFRDNKPLPIMNECIQKRYRDNGYEVIFALFPDRELCELEKKEEDKVVYTDIPFTDLNGFDENGKEKDRSQIKYADSMHILRQVGPTDKLVIGGFHFDDCVKRVALASKSIGIDTLIDLEMTDKLASLYDAEYFQLDNYSPKRYYEWLKKKRIEMGITDNTEFEEMFKERFSDDIYGLYTDEDDKTKK